MLYKIVKASRLPTNLPYTGPTCERCGVPVGKLYDSLSEAEEDAKKLSLYNPVGFVVIDVETNNPAVYKSSDSLVTRLVWIGNTSTTVSACDHTHIEKEAVERIVQLENLLQQATSKLYKLCELGLKGPKP